MNSSVIYHILQSKLEFVRLQQPRQLTGPISTFGHQGRFNELAITTTPRARTSLSKLRTLDFHRPLSGHLGSFDDELCFFGHTNFEISFLLGFIDFTTCSDFNISLKSHCLWQFLVSSSMAPFFRLHVNFFRHDELSRLARSNFGLHFLGHGNLYSIGLVLFILVLTALDT